MYPTLIDHDGTSVVNIANVLEITRGNDDTNYWIFFAMCHPEGSILWHFDSANERDAAFMRLRERLGVERV